MGRPYNVTNPYRNGDTIYWTESVFDTAGCPWKTVTPDGAVVETTYSVSATGGNMGTAVTVTDQAGKQRRSVTNALGHLTRVDEPNSAGQLGAINAPNQPTFYTYDLLNNLTEVQQPGDSNEECGPSSTTCWQTRTFVYDSLSRLKQATNPESGTIQYSYDPNGNLQTKTDARGVKTDYVYNALNRVTNRNYSTPNGTPGSGILANYTGDPERQLLLRQPDEREGQADQGHIQCLDNRVHRFRHPRTRDLP